MSKDFLDSVARIQKADVGSQVPYGNNIAPQLQTSGTPLVSSSASGDNIPQENNVVNMMGKYLPKKELATNIYI